MHELNEDGGNTREGVSVLMFVVREANQRDSLVLQLAKHFSLAVWQFDSSCISADKYLSFNKKEIYVRLPCFQFVCSVSRDYASINVQTSGEGKIMELPVP